jgi:hypothetical protein
MAFPPQMRWDKCGYGCLVNSRVVLTTANIGSKAEGDYFEKTIPVVRIGETEYSAPVAFRDEERNLAALFLDREALDAEGRAYESFPEIAKGPPNPGQALGFLDRQALHSDREDAASDSYLCFAYAYVSLLRSKEALRFGLSGVIGNARQYGQAVFDVEGKLYGIATEFLRTSVECRYGETFQGFLVFTPTYLVADLALASTKLEGTP